MSTQNQKGLRQKPETYNYNVMRDSQNPRGMQPGINSPDHTQNLNFRGQDDAGQNDVE